MMSVAARRSLLAWTILFNSFGWSAHAQDSFLSDTLVRKGQVKNVLEHQPVKNTSCHNAVVRLLLLQTNLRTQPFILAYWPY